MKGDFSFYFLFGVVILSHQYAIDTIYLIFERLSLHIYILQTSNHNDILWSPSAIKVMTRSLSKKKKSNDTEKRRRPQSLIEDWKRWYILSECSIIILLSTASNYCNLAIFNFLFFFEKVYIQLDEDWKLTSRIRLYKSICKLKMIYLYTCYIEQYYTCIFLKSGEVCMGDIMISAAW